MTRFPTVTTVTMLLACSALVQAGCRDDELAELPGSVQGRVCDDLDGEGLASAAIALQAGDGSVLEGLTDGDGNFTLGRVPAGLAVLVFDAPEREQEVVVEPQELAFVEDTACRDDPGLGPVGAIEGKVCNRHTGDAVMEADVFVSLDDGTIFVTRTSVDGEFLLENVPAGERVVQIDGEGYAQSFLVEVVAGQTARIDVGDDCTPPDLRQCVEGDSVSCYTGPAGTENVGICRAGTSTCLADGTETACTGEVHPGTEIAGNGIDEDCDGADAVCDPIEITVELSGDCVTTSCPASAPYPVGCDILMEGGDGRGCVANTPGQSVVYFQEGDVCGAGHVEGTLLCSSLVCVGQDASPIALNADNCPINKPQKIYPTSQDGCPET